MSEEWRIQTYVTIRKKGLIAIPAEVRRLMGVKEGDVFELSASDKQITLRLWEGESRG